MPVAVITGGSRGLGRALASALADLGWCVVIDGRSAASLDDVVPHRGVRVVAGDVSDPAHREALVGLVRTLGGADLLINNASQLGPMPTLLSYPLDRLRSVYETNVLAPLALTQALRPDVVVNLSSDAAVAAYAGWGGYGSSKAALDQLGAVLAVEQPKARVYSFDPGDMRTDLHQEAFPDEDISDRPSPDTVVPALLRLLDERPASGRYTKADLT